jgi:hypothetical protein
MDSFLAQPSNPPVININADDNQSELTSAHSGETPTLPGDDAPTIKALDSAATDAAYDPLAAQIPRDHKIKIRGVTFIRYALYRNRKSKRRVWYWDPKQAEEVICTKKGIVFASILHQFLPEANIIYNLGIDTKGKQMRGRRWWKCHHCNEIQHVEANNDNKIAHLREAHGITENGQKTPNKNSTIKFNNPPNLDNPLGRQSEAYVQLTTRVVAKPFEDALIALVVICQLALSLVMNDFFYGFLKVLFPKIDDVLPKSGKTIRSWVMQAFELQKERLKKELAECQSNVNFSFDLWTSPNHKALLGVVAYYIDVNRVL